MKKIQSIGIMLIILSVSYAANAQSNTVAELSITPPVYVHDEYKNIADYLTASVEYPLESINAGSQGAEIIRFSVTSTGNIDDIKIISSVSQEIDNEVIRFLKESRGNWKPGSIDGEQTSMERELILLFVLNSVDEYLQTTRNYMEKGNKQLFKRKNAEKALAYYDKAYSLMPTETSTLTMKGFCLHQLGKDEEASEINERLDHFLGHTKYSWPEDRDQLVFVHEPIEVLIASTK